LANKCAWTNFMLTWCTTTIKNAGDKFHWNFVVGLKVHPLLYKDVNLGISTKTKKETKATTMV
jgi:hypothetical protein